MMSASSRWIGALARGLAPVAALVALVVTVGLLARASGDVVLERVAILALLNMVFVVGLWSFSGLSGVFSFGHMAFAALGAYACAYLTIPVTLKASLFSAMPEMLRFLLEVHTSFPIAVVVAGCVAAAFAAVTAPAIARLRGLQAGIATLALLAIVYTVLLNWKDVTRGSSTMIGVPADLSLSGALVGSVGAIVLAWLFARSRIGLSLKAVREDEAAGRALGLRVERDRAIAWVISAFMVGAGGALYSHYITTFNPDQFYLTATFVIIAMLVVGGIGSLAGAVVGTLLYSALAEVLRRLQGGEFEGVELPAGTAEVVVALVMLLMLIKRPRGVMGGRELDWPTSGRMRRGGDTEESGKVPEAAGGLRVTE